MLHKSKGRDKYDQGNFCPITAVLIAATILKELITNH